VIFKEIKDQKRRNKASPIQQSDTKAAQRNNNKSCNQPKSRRHSPCQRADTRSVKPEKYMCPVSVINTTDREVEIQTPLVTLEKVERNTIVEMHAVQAIKKRKPIVPRAERI